MAALWEQRPEWQHNVAVVFSAAAAAGATHAGHKSISQLVAAAVAFAFDRNRLQYDIRTGCGGCYRRIYLTPTYTVRIGHVSKIGWHTSLDPHVLVWTVAVDLRLSECRSGRAVPTTAAAAAAMTLVVFWVEAVIQLRTIVVFAAYEV